MAEKRGTVYNKIYNKEDWGLVNKENKLMIEDFTEEYRQRKKKEGTIKQYFNDLRLISIYILKELGNRPFTELKKKDFRKLNIWFQERGMSNARTNRLMSSVRSMLTYIEDDDDYEYDNNIAKKVKGLEKEEVREICFLKDEQVKKIKDELIKRHDYIKALLLCLAYDSAGRRNELYQVEKNSIKEDCNSTNIVIGKRGKKFPLLYFDWTKECAKLYFEQRGEDDLKELWVVGEGNNKKAVAYNTLYEWFIRMAELLEELEGDYIPFSPHSLRHSSLENMNVGTHYVCKNLGKENGFSLEELKIYAHHSSSDTTSSYLKNKDSDKLGEMFSIKL